MSRDVYAAFGLKDMLQMDRLAAGPHHVPAHLPPSVAGISSIPAIAQRWIHEQAFSPPKALVPNPVRSVAAHAQKTVLAAYGLSKLSGEDLADVARGRTPFKPLDPAMQRLRDAQGINAAFEDNASIDPTNPNPEPGMIHRADG